MPEEENRRLAEERALPRAEALPDANIRREERDHSAAEPKTPSVLARAEAAADAACAEVRDSECSAELNRGEPPNPLYRRKLL